MTYDPDDMPTEAMAVAMPATHPGLAPVHQPRPYAPMAGGTKAAAAYHDPARGWPAGAPWPEAEWRAANPALSGPLPPSAGTATLAGPAEAVLEAAGPVSGAFQSDPGSTAEAGQRVTVADLALAQHLEAAEARAGGPASYVALARWAREWLAANAPRRWPIERKVWVGALGAGGAALLAALLTWAVDNVPAMAGVPPWLGPLLTYAGPPVIGFLSAYAARHSPRVIEQLAPPQDPDPAAS